MHIQLVKVYGFIVGILGVVGLFVAGRLFEAMNTDTAIDVLRILIAGAFLYIAYRLKNDTLAITALFAIGVLYVSMGLIALADPTIGGLLPSGLSDFDIWFHIVTGAIALLAGSVRSKDSRIVE